MHSSTVDHCQTFRCLNIDSNYKTSIKPISQGKNTLLTLVVCIHAVARKRAIIEQFGKKPLSGKIALPVCDVYQCIVALDIA
jgi:hypothetical protein